ncbi:glucan 1,3-beta-glucosidase [Verticillium alfalfae VaMs.102]|uniref:Glucan 1,3-beta-glucosidase n=1 Tax=Verticillium alfalfae (strain VaMs.102 / ATCC MYA-4576 / FGSC 10136) TaxID=526221 RepID=C9SDM0_VERA1|nr:glucan 1,3-beta-glucosidase [Verticillium alfalfae VaMs.102]EEY16441.1 glucan 1,3-beta-glucosidase [Verticillium alfalfae VaMs.102]
MGLASVITAFVLASRLFSLPALAVPAPAPQAAPSPDAGAGADTTAAASNWWFANIDRQGVAAFGVDGYQVFRNVKDFGAVGDGIADDTDAINTAMSSGNRCFFGCDSSTTTPALVYFPPGTYLVSRPLIPMYYTHMVGDIHNPPTLRAAPNFAGMAVVDANPYDNQGNNAWTNQNNFFRQMRNFVVDLTAQPFTTGTGIHWQVAQATSLQNILFRMRTDGGEANAQQGIFIDNGSGGFMTDLTFVGGRFGMFVGSQQFTTRNMTFNNCQTAIFMNWNWLWTLHGLSINDCSIGINMANGGSVGAQTVGSLLLLDSTIRNTRTGVMTAYDPSSPYTNGTLILDNVDMSSNVEAAVRNEVSQQVILPGNQKIGSWAQGKAYTPTNGGQDIQDTRPAVTKPAVLLDSNGRFATRSKPQYDNVPASSFLRAKANGCVGDGVTDDTAAIQALFNKAGPNDVVYFDHGAYIITDTVQVPKDIKITGEIWPLILAGGNSNFKDQNNPKPMLRVGEPGDVGNFEMSDLMIETQGPQPGAILMEFNVAGTQPGAAGLWDVHFRIGGTAGTQLQADKCAKTPAVTTTPNPECFGAWLLIHMTPESSGYFENVWWWVSDHELDQTGWGQINIYNGRGVLIESTKGSWLWGTASEHSVLYNYQFNNAKNVFMGHIQTETAYFQGNPDALVPFTVNAKYLDPDFEAYCAAHSIQQDRCPRTWGVRAIGSSDIFLYGAGMYSFFDNYAQECVPQNNCQDHMTSLENTSVRFFGISTKASVSMITVDGETAALDSDNRNNFCATIATFES